MIKKITVAGAGAMGSGIAHVCALSAFHVSIYDLSAPGLDKARQSISHNLERQVTKGLITADEAAQSLIRISFTQDIAQSLDGSGLVIEAITEKEDVKQAFFAQADALCPTDTLFATNTSSISITRLAAATSRADKFIGMHFMNPVPVMQLVEIIRGHHTTDTTTQTIVALSQKLGKTPVVVNDYPGFVSNRVLMPLINEAAYALMEGVAGIKEIDTILKLGMAHPMGPLQLADYIGIDVCVYIMQVLAEGLGNPKYHACPLLKKMKDAGTLGVKSGSGFYIYDDKGKPVHPAF